MRMAFEDINYLESDGWFSWYNLVDLARAIILALQTMLS